MSSDISKIKWKNLILTVTHVSYKKLTHRCRNFQSDLIVFNLGCWYFGFLLNTLFYFECYNQKVFTTLTRKTLIRTIEWAFLLKLPITTSKSVDPLTPLTLIYDSVTLPIMCKCMYRKSSKNITCNTAFKRTR